ncbi:MAG: hypothetical protein KBT57_00110 [bacterium]|nr:hypothetical protein [Candidatus Limimorpha equi]
METPQTYSRFDIHVDGNSCTYLSWEYNGVSHTASVENEYVGGRGLWGQTVSDMGGRGSYMPPGYVYSSFDNAGSGLSGLQNASLLAQSFGLGNGAKTELMDWAVRTNYKSARSWGEFRNLRATQKEFRYVNTLGKTGTRYLNVCKGLGAAAAVTSMALTDANAISYYVNGGKGAGVAIKAVMDTAMGIVGFLGPVGFAISSVYFITDLATDGFGGWGNVNP